MLRFSPMGVIMLGMLATSVTAGGLFERLDQQYQRARQAVREQVQDCAECRDTHLPIDDLRQELPSDWQLEITREPVFDANVLLLQAGMENRQTVVLVHGLGQNGIRDWLPVIPELARRYHVLSLDLPGFGYSARPRGKYSPTRYAQVIAWLVMRYAHGRPIVVGHSMGGAIALRYAANYPEQLDKLVLVDAAGILERTAFIKHSASFPLPPTQDSSELLKRAGSRLRTIGDNAVETVAGLPDPTELLKRSQTTWSLLLGNQTNVNAALALVDENFSTAIYTLRTPTEIIWGEADTVAPLRTGQMLAGQLPRARLQVLAGVGHNPMTTATSTFLAHLQSALVSTPAEQSQPPAVTSTPSKPDLLCMGEVGRRYSGQYRHVRIESCQDVELEDLQAESLLLRRASVRMQNVSVMGKATALKVEQSSLLATNARFQAATAIVADDARLDLAGVSAEGGMHAVELRRASRLIISTSKLSSPAYRGYWHGSYVGESRFFDQAGD